MPQLLTVPVSRVTVTLGMFSMRGSSVRITLGAGMTASLTSPTPASLNPSWRPPSCLTTTSSGPAMTCITRGSTSTRAGMRRLQEARTATPDLKGDS